MNPLEQFSALLGYVSIAHQIKGRVRLKIDKAVLKSPLIQDFPQVADHFNQVLRRTQGIRMLSFNRLALSCTIEYDERVIPGQAWGDLLCGKNSPESRHLLTALNDYYQEVCHPV